MNMYERIPCRACNGAGEIDDPISSACGGKPFHTCSACEGTGEVCSNCEGTKCCLCTYEMWDTEDQRGETERAPIMQVCSDCGGRGWLVVDQGESSILAKCKMCQGARVTELDYAQVAKSYEAEAIGNGRYKEVSRTTLHIIVERARRSWPETWMSLARTIAENRSHDPRLQVCALVVPEDNTGIIALGYNGLPAGGSNAIESTEPGRSGTTHAEVNCLIKCPFHYPTKKHMYVTHSPCIDCAKLIVNSRISRVVYGQEYRDRKGIDLLRSAGIEVLTLGDAIEDA